jgi:hypothetical protein
MMANHDEQRHLMIGQAVRRHLSVGHHADADDTPFNGNIPAIRPAARMRTSPAIATQRACNLPGAGQTKAVDRASSPASLTIS